MVQSEYENKKDIITASLMKNTQDLAFPRLVASEGEKKAQNWVKTKITELGYDVHTEPVLTSTYRIDLTILSNVVGAVLCPLSTILLMIHPLLFLIPIVVILVNIYLISTGSVQMGQVPKVPKYVKILETENIIAETPKKADNREVVLIGHYDSKSSRLNGVQRVVAYLVLTICALIIILGGILGIVLFYILGELPLALIIILWIVSILGFVAGIVLSFNNIGNLSPGAVDNATAVAILLESMKYFKAHPIEGVNLTFLFSAAEEIGLTGALQFLLKRKDLPAWSVQNTRAINWDLAGVVGPMVVNTAIGIPRRETSEEMNKSLAAIGKEQQISFSPVYLPIGGWHDGLPFIEFGYECAVITGKNFLIHSPADNMELVDPQNLFHAFILGIELIKKIAVSSNAK